ncbi:MAG: hypothetical protein H0V20_10445 [Actinobacteria bacterium]|nr:hypothetical protein [Actinomycetota bacterium]
MARADWTYEVAPAGAPASGLEEYRVETTSGTHVGKVTVLLSRRDELLVAVERGTPPATHDVRVFPWRDVAAVDHAALRVRLNVSDEGIEQSLELDPDKGIEGEGADASRITELPRELRPSSSPAAPGPVDRPSTALALGLGLLGLFSLLVLAIAAITVEFDWEFVLFVVPLSLLVGAAVVAYRLFRDPYDSV